MGYKIRETKTISGDLNLIFTIEDYIMDLDILSTGEVKDNKATIGNLGDVNTLLVDLLDGIPECVKYYLDVLHIIFKWAEDNNIKTIKDNISNNHFSHLCYCGETEGLKYLIDKGIKDNISSSNSGLRRASRWGHLPNVRVLTAKMNYTNLQIHRALSDAEYNKHKDIQTHLEECLNNFNGPSNGCIL